MLKELTVKEALTLLAENHDKEIQGYFWNEDDNITIKGVLHGISKYNYLSQFINVNIRYEHFAIEVPDEYRYMTQQECIDWVCLHGIGYQVVEKDRTDWMHPCNFEYDCPNMLLYRTIKEIDNKIVYGEPKEFKVRIQ